MTSDVRVVRFEQLITPGELLAELPAPEEAMATVQRGREELRAAIAGRDDRLVVITGPCSIHERESALEYADRLALLRRELSDRLILVMRTYFEKPRTTLGWKGLIYDPGRDESYDVARGLRAAREVLLAINRRGVPCATEFLDPIVPQYTADLVSWAAIGARTTESQTHRQMASGLSMPVGFKNSTDGSFQSAVNAMAAAAHPQAFLGIDPLGRTSIVHTRGNRDVHLVLRGGAGGPTYSQRHLAQARELLAAATGSQRAILVDCSHANSGKDYRKQPRVFRHLLRHALGRGLLGLMLESHLVEGRQPIGPGLRYGQSITDGCIGWEDTERLLRDAAACS